MSDSTLFERGLAIRREVLGAEYVDKSINSATDFNKEFQKLVTENCWGQLWGRDTLTRRERSLMNLVMISALNRPHELKLHVKGALNNGLTSDDIKEALLQVMVYCGVPAAVDSFRIAREVIEGEGK